MSSVFEASYVNVGRRSLLRGIGAVAAGVSGVLPGLSLAQQREQATLATGSAGYTWALTAVAESAGYWKKRNVDLRVQDFTTGRDAMQALLGGSANFSTTTDTPLVFAVLQGLKPAVLANFSRYSYDMKIVASERSGIDPRNPSSLKGRRIGTPAGTSGQYALAKYLEFAKLAPGDITQINIAPSDLVGALVRGDIDAFSWTALAGSAAQRQSGGKVVFLTQNGYEKYFRSHQLLLVNQATLSSRKALLSDAVNALLDAENHIHTNAAWPDQVSSRVRSTPEEIRQFTSTFEFKVEFNKSFVEDLVSQAQWAIDNKLAPRPKGDLRELFRSVIHDETLKSINPSRVSLG
ncbi:NrtA/SsuA/CpmA family ABC transporter substrate-binding protein [Cupriavidus metallidurans]|uniref:ABC transporter substrate-binding protein n=1 Tax=Cupriavidus TaxID=106589 RepID=UPI0025801CCD|nr:MULTISPECIES: NrtA/SsuA/CpmA family ABC transporter substrate-binding protein [unclassified Cupriavidus]GMG93465.1 hypothetical protein Cmtc_46850 [Cupriavidus sp. TKC]